MADERDPEPVLPLGVPPSLAGTALGSLSVIIPAFNAQPVLAATLDDVRAWLVAAGIQWEILVIDDGSVDETAAIAQSVAGVQLLRNERNRGKGFSVRRGMLASNSDLAWALFLDADNSTRIHHLSRFAPVLDHADVLIASRRVPGARIVRQQQRVRETLGKTFPLIVRAVALPGLRDTQCGFKLVRRSAVEPVFRRQRVERFAFDVEVLLIARRLGLRITEVPVDWDNPTASTLRISTDTTVMLWDLIRSAWRLRRGPGAERAQTD